ncbi:MAG: Fe-S cluster assembly ATPase SufC [Patescibacteria group bacterium]|jgi:Fe-S cluster assembly ATP-binding protein
MLKINNLSVNASDKKIIENLSLEIEAGEVVAIMGPNGSGKSTLVSSIMGSPNYDCSAGRIIFNHKDLTKLSADKRSALGIYVASQHPIEIPGLTVASMLRAAVKNHPHLKVTAASFRSNLISALNSVGLDQSYANRAVNDGMSGGEKKRLELAQALVLQPKLLILDEIDSGLDVDALHLVADVINQYRAPDRAIIIITHYQRLLDLVKVDRVLVMQDGAIVRIGGADLSQKVNSTGFSEINK